MILCYFNSNNKKILGGVNENNNSDTTLESQPVTNPTQTDSTQNNPTQTDSTQNNPDVITEKVQQLINAECIVNEDVLKSIENQLKQCPNITFKGGYNYHNNYAKY